MNTVDGVREFMVSRFLLRDEDGSPYAIGGIAADITERRGAERALAERDRLLDSVIGASPDMITLMDRAGKIHQISEAESALFGHRHEVFTRSDVFDFVHPELFEDVPGRGSGQDRPTGPASPADNNGVVITDSHRRPPTAPPARGSSRAPASSSAAVTKASGCCHGGNGRFAWASSVYP